MIREYIVEIIGIILIILAMVLALIKNHKEPSELLTDKQEIERQAEVMQINVMMACGMEHEYKYCKKMFERRARL